MAGGISPANAIGVYQAKGAASQAASYSNLANPGTYDLTLGVAPTWATGTGWAFDGTQYLKTGITSSSAAWSMIVRVTGAVAADYRAIIHCRNGTPNRFYIQYDSPNTKYIFGNDGALGAVGAAAAATVLAVAGPTAYQNGSALTGVISPNTNPSTYPLIVGGFNNAGTLGGSFVGNIVAVAVYNATLTSGQVSSLTTAMNAL